MRVKLLHHCNVATGIYYYMPKGWIRGRKPYAKKYTKSGVQVSKDVILEEVKCLFSKPFVDYRSYKTIDT